ncbi:MAG: hypothetical protein ACRDKT_00910 [Actinomycetota bacterium]
MAEIVVLSGETRRLSEFLDEELDPGANPLVALLSDRLPYDRWLVLQDLLRRKLAFFCISWFTWDATLEIARRLRVTETPEAFSTELPAEIHELMWADIPQDIISSFDNSSSYRSFNDRWSELVNEWAAEHGWDPFALPFKAAERHEELLELESWLEERGYGDHRKPIRNLLVEVMGELADRARAFVVRRRTPDELLDEFLVGCHIA